MKLEGLIDQIRTNGLVVSAVMQMLSVVVKTEVRVKKQDLSIDRLGVNETAHTNDQNEFLRKVAGLSLRMRILVNRRSLE